MATIDDSDVPETGAVFTFGRSRFADNLANKFWIRNDRIVHINCGDEHSVVVTERGRLYAFGTNDWGQLGLGHTKAANKPSFIKALKPHKMVLAACGRTHTIVASESGKIFSFGAGGDGQLGHGDTEDQNTPKQIEGLPERKVKILSCGVYHSAALFDSGDLYTWGSGSDGQSGHKEEETLAPKVLKFGSKVKWVSCGYYHTAVVTDDGKLYTFGEDENGKLGTTGSKDTSRPQPVATEDGHFIAAACGSGHTVGLTKEGKVFTFGDGSRGQLGQGTRVQQLSEPKVVQQLSNLKVNFVSCGDCHTAAITDRGKLYTFGDGRHGKLAQGEECFSNLFKPQVVSRFADFNVQYVSCGGCHTLVIAVKREEDLSDDEDAEDNILNSSMASTYSHASMPEANATMRLGLQGLSNTLPLISPRDKRRKKEAENLANSLNGSFKHVSKSDLPAISTLDRGRLPALNKLKDAPVIDNKSNSKVNEEIIRENNNELLSNKEIEKNIKNSLKASDELAFKSRLENELDDTDKKTNKSKDIKDGGIKDKDSKTLDKQAALASKSKEDSDEEESDGDEESEEDDESSEYEDEEDDEEEAGDEASSKSSKSKTDGSGSKSIEAVAADSKIKPGVSKKEALKVEAEDDDDEEDDDEEDDEDDEGDDDDDEEESEEEDDDDEEEDDEDDDEDDDDEESETEGEDGDEIKAVKSEDSASSSKEGDKASKVTVEVEANSSNDKNKDNKKSDIKDKSKEKENKKKGKDKSKDSEDKKDGETSGNKNPETADKDDVKSKDGDAEGEHNNNENQEKTENTENDKPEEDKKIQKSKFGSIFGKKKPPAATAPAVEVSKDEANGPAAKGTQKKTGKSGVCTIL